MKVDYSLLPEHMRGGAKRWIEDGIQPGGFMMSVIANDLFGAVQLADHINKNRLQDICSFFYNEAPSGCWGSKEIAKAWYEAKRKPEAGG